MKFCPFCGVKTVPGDMFCQECGALIVEEPVPQSTPANPLQEPLVPKIPKPRCIHCGNYLAVDDKFCLECGSKVEEPAEDLVEKPPQPIATVQEPIIKPSCGACGVVLVPGDRFCAECGADTLNPQPITAAAAPIAAPVLSPPKPEIPRVEKPEPKVSQKPPKPVVKPAEPISTPVAEQPAAKPKKSKWWIAVIAVVVVLGGLAATWFLVIKKDKAESTVDTMAVVAQTPQAPVVVTPTVDSASLKQAQADKDQPKQSVAQPEPAKPKSTKKENAAKPKKDARKATTETKKEDPKANKTDFQVVKKTNKTPIIIYSNWNDKPVKNNPWTKTRFELNGTVVITRIKTLHFNKGQGVPVAGTISLVDENRVTYGPWQCTAQTADDGTPSAKWVCEPNAIVPAGKYKVVNSGEDTWSWNSESDRKGFMIVEGYQK